MTKPKPPFARAVEIGSETFCVEYGVGPHLVHGWPMSELEAVACASDLNAEHEAAVAAREARLVAALRLAVDIARTDDGDLPSNWRKSLDDCEAALEGTGPDLVAELRAQVEALRAENGPWMVLNDLAQTGGLGSDEAREVMRALGIAPQPTVRLAGVKGGKVTAMAIEAVEKLRSRRDRLQPPRQQREAFNRWEGEQAAFGMVLAVLRGQSVD